MRQKAKISAPDRQEGLDLLGKSSSKTSCQHSTPNNAHATPQMRLRQRYSSSYASYFQIGKRANAWMGLVMLRSAVLPSLRYLRPLPG